MYRWAPGAHAASIFLEPSGGTETKGFREPGSNGLKPGGRGRLLVADSGNRAIVLLDLRTKAKRLIAQRFEGKKLNSPNDLAVGPDGAIWFTDPPYGLEGIEDSPLKEQSANRVYRLGPDGKVTAIEVADSLSQRHRLLAGRANAVRLQFRSKECRHSRLGRVT